MSFAIPAGGVLVEPLVVGDLALARPRPEDREPLIQLLLQPGLLRSSIGVDHADRATAERWLDRRLGSWEQHGIGLAAVFVAGVVEPVGLVGLRIGDHGPGGAGGGCDEAADGPRGTEVLEAGWRTHPAQQGRGIARRAVEAWLRIAFDELAATTVSCRIDPRNAPSLAVAANTGFRNGTDVVIDMPQHADRHVPHVLSWVRPRDVAALALERLVTDDPNVEANRQTTLALLARDEVDVLDRDDEGHVTGSALVVDAAAERVLLLWHEKLHIWVQPGGHLDGDWDLLRSAAREAHEETGIDGLRPLGRLVDLDIHLVAPKDAPPHRHHDARTVLIAPEGAEPVANAEAKRFRWLTLDEVDADPGVDVGLRRLARVGLAAAKDLVAP